MEKVVFKSDFFTDFTGKERLVTFAAVSVNLDINSEIVIEKYNGEKEYYTYYTYSRVKKELCFGVSVQNPADKPNPELGKIIAHGKAKKRKLPSIFSEDKGLINTNTVEAFLNTHMLYFKQNPGSYLKGYDRDKFLFETNKEEYYKKYNIKQ